MDRLPLTSEQTPPSEEVSLADAELVSRQASVGVEEAMAALRQTNGDLARAILLLLHKDL